MKLPGDPGYNPKCYIGEAGCDCVHGVLKFPKSLTFVQELETLLNKHGWDSTLGIPDYILAKSLDRTLMNMLETQNEVKAHERGI
jgi:hypothetical protein